MVFFVVSVAVVFPSLFFALKSPYFFLDLVGQVAFFLFFFGGVLEFCGCAVAVSCVWKTRRATTFSSLACTWQENSGFATGSARLKKFLGYSLPTILNIHGVLFVRSRSIASWESGMQKIAFLLVVRSV